jgi:bacterioferritin
MKDFEKIMDDFFDNITCKSKKPYPKARVEYKNPRYAKLLMDAYADGGKSEFTAISQYIFHHFTIHIKEISNAMLCIAISEMKHLELLGETIRLLGGSPKYRRGNRMWWTGGEVDYGDNICFKLSLDIESEKAAISGYKLLLSEIQDKYIRQTILRIIEDEKEHEEIFTALYNKYCKYIER